MLNFNTVDRLILVDTLVSLYDEPRPKGFYFPGESHDFWEGVFVYQGEVTATADERIYQLSPGMLLLHKPMEFHRIWAAQDCEVRIVNLSFRANGQAMNHLKNGCFHLSKDQQCQFREITQIFSQAERYKEVHDTHAFRLTENITASLLEVFLLRLSENSPFTQEAHSYNDERYSKIVQIMKENCHRNLSLEDLSVLCEMSVSNMKRIFAMYSDVGIAKYFLALKMRRAMELIDKDIPFNCIAEMLQYPEVSYFYTVFKRETGMTPSQYRNRDK